ncbi:hypothetical protein COO60DRAFT_1497742 [Scenedesmus sp. NREL 46B-D3]|nr:hypothetical protein COO60DRAFT_1497742 [Scenedesmus sp. NREL 46B-D3]
MPECALSWWLLCPLLCSQSVPIAIISSTSPTTVAIAPARIASTPRSHGRASARWWMPRNVSHIIIMSTVDTASIPIQNGRE